MQLEEQLAAAVKRIVIWLSVLSVAITIAIGLATWGLLDAQSGLTDARQNAAALTKSVNSPSHVRNVLLWCDAINAGRAYDRGFVKHVSKGRLRYTLQPLPCQQIAGATHRAISTKH